MISQFIFYETKAVNGITQRHYYKVDKNGKETYEPDSDLDAQYSAQGLYAKEVEVLAYRHYVIKDDGQLINDHNVAIPDYDMLLIGRKNQHIDAQKKLEHLLEYLPYHKTSQFGEIHQGQENFITALQAITGSMVKHGAETGNRNPEKFEGDFVFFVPKLEHETKPNQSFCDWASSGVSACLTSLPFGIVSFLGYNSKVTSVETDKGKIMVAHGLEGVTELIASTRKSGFDTEIGPRWGFVFDRKTEKVSYDKDKRDIWKALYKEEDGQLKGFCESVKNIASNLNSVFSNEEISRLQIGDTNLSDEERKQKFLEILKTKFPKDRKDPSKSFVKDFFDPEYFADIKFDFQSQSHKTIDLENEINKSIPQALSSLDIISQYERILQLQLAPKFKTQDADAESKSQQFEKLLSAEIEQRKQQISRDISKHRGLVEDQGTKFANIDKDLGLGIDSVNSMHPSSVVYSSSATKLNGQKEKSLPI